VVFMSLNREIGTNHCHRCPGLIARQFQVFFLLFRASGSIYIYIYIIYIYTRTYQKPRTVWVYLFAFNDFLVIKFLLKFIAVPLRAFKAQENSKPRRMFVIVFKKFIFYFKLIFFLIFYIILMCWYKKNNLF
jgi:hypothetical protein